MKWERYFAGKREDEKFVQSSHGGILSKEDGKTRLR
jgi:hypothetical protein